MPRSAVRETYAKAMEPYFVLMEARAVAGLMQLSLLFIAVPFVVICILYQFDVLGGREGIAAALDLPLSSCAYAHALSKAGMEI